MSEFIISDLRKNQPYFRAFYCVDNWDDNTCDDYKPITKKLLSSDLIT